MACVLSTLAVKCILIFAVLKYPKMFQTLLLEKQNGRATIKLNRPEVYNAFNELMKKELQDALKDVEKDKEVRAVIITGEGKAFCSGQDLKEVMNMPNRSFLESLNTGYNPIIRAMRNMPKPIICKLNGVAAGAGCSLALACDLIIAAEEASMTEIFINIGLVLDSGSSYFLPRIVGSTKAFELATTGKKISGKEAVEFGIANRAVPLSELDAAVEEISNYSPLKFGFRFSKNAATPSLLSAELPAISWQYAS
jgi:2-(1,2-epoxy-1,2-dihydrophenyl)acetyl-CoA isomerase